MYVCQVSLVHTLQWIRRTLSFNNDNRNIFVSPPNETGRGIAYIYQPYGIHEHDRPAGMVDKAKSVPRHSYRDCLLHMKSIQVNGQNQDIPTSLMLLSGTSDKTLESASRDCVRNKLIICSCWEPICFVFRKQVCWGTRNWNSHWILFWHFNSNYLFMFRTYLFRF